MKHTFEEVADVVKGERAYQDAGQGNAKRHEGAADLTVGEIILGMEEILAQARAAWYKPDGGVAALPYIRKTAGMAFQAMERYGAPRREGF